MGIKCKYTIVWEPHTSITIEILKRDHKQLDNLSSNSITSLIIIIIIFNDLIVEIEISYLFGFDLI